MKMTYPSRRVLDRIKNAYSNFKNRNEKPAVKNAVTPAPMPAQPQAVKKEMTKEELVSGIKDDLETSENIFNVMPAMKTVIRIPAIRYI